MKQFLDFVIRMEKDIYQKSKTAGEYYRAMANQYHSIHSELEEKRRLRSRPQKLNGDHQQQSNSSSSDCHSVCLDDSDKGELVGCGINAGDPTSCASRISDCYTQYTFTDALAMVCNKQDEQQSSVEDKSDLLPTVSNQMTDLPLPVGNTVDCPTSSTSPADYKRSTVTFSDVDGTVFKAKEHSPAQDAESSQSDNTTSVTHSQEQQINSCDKIKSDGSSGPPSMKLKPEESNSTPADDTVIGEASITTTSDIKKENDTEYKKDPPSQAREPSNRKIWYHNELHNHFTPIIDNLSKEKDAEPFLQPVDWEALEIYDYPQIVSRPMDISTIRRKLDDREYKDPWDVVDDVWLMLNNAWLYNKKTSKVYKSCTRVSCNFHFSNICFQLAEIFESYVDPIMQSLGFCCGHEYYYQPPPLTCLTPKFCTIHRDMIYYVYKNSTVQKSLMEKCKNDVREKEPFVFCKQCGRKWHRVCAVHMEEIWSEGFICNHCIVTYGLRRSENRFTARKLSTCKLSNSLEKRVNDFLRKKGVNDTEVIIRVLAAADKVVEVKKGMKSRFCESGDMPETFPYRMKAIFAFQENDGHEVCFFGLHVQEYGSECPNPNTRRVYLAYLDSVYFFNPKQYRTDIYHELLIGYIQYAKRLGFTVAHIWACPPSEGDDYIFHMHPPDQKIPKPKRLQEWYQRMLKKALLERIVVDYKDIYKDAYDSRLDSPSELAYFEGDFWPNTLEELFKEMDEEDAQRKREQEALARDGDEDDSKESIQSRDTDQNPGKKKAKKRKFKRNSTITSSGKRKRLSVGGSDMSSEISRRVYEIMEKHKENFFVIRLHPQNIVSSLPPIEDPDPLMNSELMECRGAFLEKAREKHLGFSSIRRAKYSTLAMLYELHNENRQPLTYTCNACNIQLESPWHCNQCPEYDLCPRCYETKKHQHPMVQIGLTLEYVNRSQDSDNEAAMQESGREKVNRLVKALSHWCSCRDANCRVFNCKPMKANLQHFRIHSKPGGHQCVICRKLSLLCYYHAKACHQSNCQVPLCSTLKAKMQQQQKQQRLKQTQMLRRRMATMQRCNSSTTPNYPPPTPPSVPPPAGQQPPPPPQQQPPPSGGFSNSYSHQMPHLSQASSPAAGNLHTGQQLSPYSSAIPSAPSCMASPLSRNAVGGNSLPSPLAGTPASLQQNVFIQPSNSGQFAGFNPQQQQSVLPSTSPVVKPFPPVAPRSPVTSPLPPMSVGVHHHHPQASFAYSHQQQSLVSGLPDPSSIPNNITTSVGYHRFSPTNPAANYRYTTSGVNYPSSGVHMKNVSSYSGIPVGDAPFSVANTLPSSQRHPQIANRPPPLQQLERSQSAIAQLGTSGSATGFLGQPSSSGMQHQPNSSSNQMQFLRQPMSTPAPLPNGGYMQSFPGTQQKSTIKEPMMSVYPSQLQQQTVKTTPMDSQQTAYVSRQAHIQQQQRTPPSAGGIVGDGGVNWRLPASVGPLPDAAYVAYPSPNSVGQVTPGMVGCSQLPTASNCTAPMMMMTMPVSTASRMSGVATSESVPPSAGSTVAGLPPPQSPSPLPSGAGVPAGGIFVAPEDVRHVQYNFAALKQRGAPISEFYNWLNANPHLMRAWQFIQQQMQLQQQQQMYTNQQSSNSLSQVHSCSSNSSGFSASSQSIPQQQQPSIAMRSMQHQQHPRQPQPSQSGVSYLQWSSPSSIPVPQQPSPRMRSSSMDQLAPPAAPSGLQTPFPPSMSSSSSSLYPNQSIPAAAPQQQQQYTKVNGGPPPPPRYAAPPAVLSAARRGHQTRPHSQYSSPTRLTQLLNPGIPQQQQLQTDFEDHFYMVSGATKSPRPQRDNTTAGIRFSSHVGQQQPNSLPQDYPGSTHVISHASLPRSLPPMVPGSQVPIRHEFAGPPSSVMLHPSTQHHHPGSLLNPSASHYPE